MANNELYHYGRKGMKWGKNIFGKDNITSKLGSAARRISGYRQTEANAKRDLLKQITLDSIELDRQTGRNMRTSVTPTFSTTTERTANALRNKINQANQVFGKKSNWGSTNYKESAAYKMDRGKRYLNEVLKSFGKKPIFTEAFKDNADYGKKFIFSKSVTNGILKNRYLNYEYDLREGRDSLWNKNPKSQWDPWTKWYT